MENNLQSGDKVKFSQDIIKFYTNCKHYPSNLDCGCKDHLAEFINCIGIVIGLTEYDDKTFEELDVRWEPSKLKYSYMPWQLEKI